MTLEPVYVVVGGVAAAAALRGMLSGELQNCCRFVVVESKSLAWPLARTLLLADGKTVSLVVDAEPPEGDDAEEEVAAAHEFMRTARMPRRSQVLFAEPSMAVLAQEPNSPRTQRLRTALTEFVEGALARTPQAA